MTLTEHLLWVRNEVREFLGSIYLNLTATHFTPGAPEAWRGWGVLWASLLVYQVVPPIASRCLVKSCHLSSPKETSDPYGCTGCALKTCIQAGEENGVSVGNRTSGRCLSGADRRCAEERGLAQDLGARSGPLRSPRGHELECMSSQWVLRREEGLTQMAAGGEAQFFVTWASPQSCPSAPGHGIWHPQSTCEGGRERCVEATTWPQKSHRHFCRVWLVIHSHPDSPTEDHTRA